LLRSRTLLYHLLFWGALYLFWILVLRNYSLSLTKTATIEFCYLVFITADFYAISHFLLPQLVLKRRYLRFILISSVIIGLSSWLRALTAVQMNRYFFHPVQIPSFATLYLNSVTNIFFWVLLITVVKMTIDKAQTQQQLEHLEKERIRNELDYLKAQINPHALFNSLNTIYGHIDKTNQVARNTLLQFSELLRYQLYDCGAEKVSLEKEISYLKNYAAFQRLRKEDQLVVIFQIENIKTGLLIAPLLLVVLVENAFKFVSNFTGAENRITISICAKDGVLHSSFVNTKEKQLSPGNNNSNGIGLANLKRRLDLLYSGRYELATTAGADFYETTLKIDLA